MVVLVIGGGGREHAIVWKLAQSPKVDKILCAPGNGGIRQLAECIDIKADDVAGVVRFAKEKGVDLVFVAPDDPLALGMVDALEAEGIRAFGPRKAAARIEASKTFAKELMQKYHIPTAQYRAFSRIDEAMAYLESCSYPTVIKADGLALGKGVVIAENSGEAHAALRSMMEDRAFGNAGASVVIEEFLTGREMTVLAFTDGKTIVPMLCSQDHKRAYDGDKGLNTGGMGAFAPSPIYTGAVQEFCEEHIFRRTVDALNQEGIEFRGVLYFGLMLTDDGVKVIEYNARFGDPETQVVLPLLKTDLMDIIEAVLNGELDKLKIEWENKNSVCVVAASGGYPEHYQKGLPIEIAPMKNGSIVFHAGTTISGAAREPGCYMTAGGRVLGITALGDTLEEAAERAYEDMGAVHFDKMHFRKDIGKRAR